MPVTVVVAQASVRCQGERLNILVTLGIYSNVDFEHGSGFDFGRGGIRDRPRTAWFGVPGRTFFEAIPISYRDHQYSIEEFDPGSD